MELGRPKRGAESVAYPGSAFHPEPWSMTTRVALRRVNIDQGLSERQGDQQLVHWVKF
jgi:hypothetical protein